MLQNHIRSALGLAIAAMLLLVAIFMRGEAIDISDRILDDEDHYYLPPARWMEAFSMGYNEVAADILWSTTLVYFGGKKHWRSGGDGSETSKAPTFTINYLKLVSALDPRFVGVYRDGGRLTLYHTGRITEASVKMAIELLERGRRYFPDDGEIAFNLGFMHYFELRPFLPKDPESPKRRFHLEEGAKLIQMAASMDNAPPYVSLLAGSLLKREGMTDLVVEHLRAMLVKETNPNIRKTLEAQLVQALGEQASRDIEAAHDLQVRWKSKLPYAPFDIFLLTLPEFQITIDEIEHPESRILVEVPTESE